MLLNKKKRKLRELSHLIFLIKENSNYLESLTDFKSLDDLEDYLLNLIDNQDNDLLLNSIGSSDDLQLFSYYPGFIDFVEKYLAKILTSKKVGDSLKKELRKWIEINCPDAVINHEQKISSNLQSYLLITIFPIRGKTKKNNQKLLSIQAELITNWDETQNIDKTDNIPVKLEKEDTKEDGYLEKEIPNLIYKFINIAQNKYLRSHVDNNQIYDSLKIELFLTKEFFIKDFEFKIPDDWKRNQQAICQKYSVILRSLDRLLPDKTHWLNSCMKKWHGMNTTAKIGEKILELKHENELNTSLSTPRNRNKLGGDLKDKFILKISCGLPKNKPKITDLFNIIFEKGVPLCLWIKRKEKKDDLYDSDYQEIIQKLSEFIEQLIETESLKDTDKLHEIILNIREDYLTSCCQEKCLGYHLRILCDYTKRRPNLPGFNPLTTNY